MSQAVQTIAETVAATPHGCSVALLCRAGGLSRASYYRHHFPLCASTALEMNTPRQVIHGPRDQWDLNQTTVRDTIQQIALEMPAYGYRCITQELHHRGLTINHKRVLRLMREDNLLCLRKKRFIATTDSKHAHPAHPNLAAELTVAGLDQLWVGAGSTVGG